MSKIKKNGNHHLISGGMRSYTSPVPNIFPPPESMRPTLIGENYMITAGHPLVAKIASDILNSNGNAIDAGVAAGLASNVIQSDMCNLGGVAPIILKTASSKDVWSISGVGTWSNSLTLNDYLVKHNSDIPVGAPERPPPPPTSPPPSPWRTAPVARTTASCSRPRWRRAVCRICTSSG